MSDEKTDKGGSDADTGPQGQGVNGPTGGAEVEAQSQGNSLLEGSPKERGPQNPKPEAGPEGDGDLNWLFGGIWNSSLEEGEERNYEPRSRIFATELGKAPVDVYLAMKGTKPSNPPNGRSKRKFEAGNMWEWIVGIVLRRAGIIRSAQERVETQLPGQQPVSGRLDFIAGGKIDPKLSKAALDSFELPAAFYKAFDRIVDHLQKKYPDGLADKPLEIKSLSAFMFEILEKSKKPLRVHVRQLMHYMDAKNMDVGHVVYICRDDCRMLEFVVVRNKVNMSDYHEAIKLRSGYYQRDEMPPLEKPLIWDPDMLRFSKNNLGMAYSPYLTMLYGYRDQEAFDEVWVKKSANFNRVLKRIAQGKKMTPLNETVLVEMREMDFDPEALAKMIPADAPDEEEEAPAAE